MNVQSVWRFLCVSLCLLFLCCIGASASQITQEEIDSYSQGVIDEVIEDPVVEDPEDPYTSQTDYQNVYTAENPLYVSVTSETGDGDTALDLPVSYAADTGDYGVSLLADAPITAADTSGLKAVLLTVLGDYEPILFEYQYGNSSVGREVFQDDVWLCSFWMLMLLTFCVFKMIGGWLTRKK